MQEYYCLVHTLSENFHKPEVDKPLLFKTHDEAFNEMCAQLAKITEYSISALKESYLSGVECDAHACAHTCVLENSAWYDVPLVDTSNNWDIFVVQAPADDDN